MSKSQNLPPRQIPGLRPSEAKTFASDPINIQCFNVQNECRFGILNLGFYWSLELEHWDFRFARSARNGYAALTMTLLVMFASLTVVGGLTLFSLLEVRSNRVFIKSVESRVIAEAGVEDGLYRVVSGKQIGASEELGVGKGTTTVTVTTVGAIRTIRSAGARESIQQNIESAVEMTTTGTNFVYGVLVGEGGLEMSNNSTVSGSVYSNGSIIGATGAVVTGDALAAGTSQIRNLTINGNAQADLIDDSTVGGYASSTTKLDDVIIGKDAHADELDDTTVTQDAYYNLIDATSVVLGAKVTPTTPPANLAAIAFPIAASTVDRWKSDAAIQGIISSGTCSDQWSPPSNPYTTNGGVIERSIKLDNNQLLILKGTVWAKCNVDIDNGASIQLDPVYAASSGMLIADGWMHLKNNGIFRGSGSPGSYLLLLTTAVGGGHHDSAVDLHNNAAGAIFYAANGLIYLHQNVAVTELTAKKLHLENNTTVVYELGLADVRFSAGPSGGYEVKYWKEVE